MVLVVHSPQRKRLPVVSPNFSSLLGLLRLTLLGSRP